MAPDDLLTLQHSFNFLKFIIFVELERNNEFSRNYASHILYSKYFFFVERSRSPIQIVFPEEAPGKSPSEPVDFFIKRESPSERQSPPSKKESPIQSQLLQNIQNIVNLNNTLNPTFAALNAASAAAASTATNINDDTKSQP